MKQIVLALLGLGIVSSAFSQLRFGYTSSSESWVGYGETLDLRNDTPGFAYTLWSDSHSISFNATLDTPILGVYDRRWSLYLVAPGANDLQAGSYLGATRWPFELYQNPGLSFDVDWRGDNSLTGDFLVEEVMRDAGGSLLSFAADFTQYDEGIPSWWNYGYIRFNSNIPVRGDLSSVPESSTIGLVISCGIFALCWTRKRLTKP